MVRSPSAVALTMISPAGMLGSSSTSAVRMKPVACAATTGFMIRHRAQIDMLVAADVVGALGLCPGQARPHSEFTSSLISCSPIDRKRLEQLWRYITRPTTSDERAQLNAADQVELKLKTPWRDGTTHLASCSLEFMHGWRRWYRSRGCTRPADLITAFRQ